MTYRSGNKMVYDLPPVPGTRERIATFFGRELAESLLWVEGQLDSMQLWGYVAHPSQSRSSAKGQFLFIGGRYVRDRSLSHALNEAYRGLLMVGRMPVAFLHLEIPADEVDVNVHPTKVEVRFRDSQRVYSHLLSTLRQTFLKSDLHARLQATSEPAAAESARVAVGATATPDMGFGAGTGVPFGSSAERLELAGGPNDRQTVASWFEPSRPQPRLPESIGAPESPSWAQSLPLAFPVVPGEAFDEFASSAGMPDVATPRSYPVPDRSTGKQGERTSRRRPIRIRPPDSSCGGRALFSIDRSRGTGGIAQRSRARRVVNGTGRAREEGHPGP